MLKKLLKPIFGMLLALIMLSTGAKAALATTYIYANNQGGVYTEYGDGQYWYTHNNEGYCGHIDGSCSPTYMKYTYSGCTLSNYAVWDNPDWNNWEMHDVFVPRVDATTRNAPYTLTYYQWWSFGWGVDQYSYYDNWVRTTPGDPWWLEIRNTWLDDNPCEGGSPKIGFDEIKITL